MGVAEPLTRGLWLIFLDVTLISFGWSFSLLYPFFNVITMTKA